MDGVVDAVQAAGHAEPDGESGLDRVLGRLEGIGGTLIRGAFGLLLGSFLFVPWILGVGVLLLLIWLTKPRGRSRDDRMYPDHRYPNDHAPDDRYPR